MVDRARVETVEWRFKSRDSFDDEAVGRERRVLTLDRLEFVVARGEPDAPDPPERVTPELEHPRKGGFGKPP